MYVPIEKPTQEQLQEWNKILSAEGLGLDRSEGHHLVFVENTDQFQTRKVRTGSTGGRLRRYGLGNKRQVSLVCQQCGHSFTAKRRDAIFCTNACRELKRDRSEAIKQHRRERIQRTRNVAAITVLVSERQSENEL